MRRVLHACLVCLVVAPMAFSRGAHAETVTLEVDFKLTDRDYHPLAGVPLRLVFGAGDWQAPAAGTRIVTDAEGTAHFTTEAVVDRRWHWSNVGFTPLSMPSRVDHIAVAAELEVAVPRRDGGETVHHWLYTADIDRFRDGDCATDDLDEIYEAGPDGRFTRLLGSGASGPNFAMRLDGFMLHGAGYRMWNYLLAPDAGDATGKRWRLRLGLMRFPKPILR